MVEGIPKSAQSTTPISVAPAKDTQPLGHDAPVIHDEIYRFFNIASYDNFNTDHLNAINSWTTESDNIGKGLRKLRKLENKLGAPSVGETRISKLYNWIRLSSHMNSVRSEMDKELTSIGVKAKGTISNVKQSYKEKVSNLDAEIASLNQIYKNTEKQFKLNATQSSKEIRNRYGRQLEELKQMRNAFRGGKLWV